MAFIEKRVSRDGSIKYRAKVRLHGFPPISGTFERKSDAKEWAQGKEAAIREGRYFPERKAAKHTVHDLLDAYLTNLASNNPRRHKEVKPLLDLWDCELGVLRLSHLTGEEILKAQQKLMVRPGRLLDQKGNALPLSSATVNRYLIALNTAIKFGVKPLKWINQNPVTEVQKLKESSGRTRFLSSEEITKLLQACRNSKNKYLLPIVILGIATGARRNEIRYLRWENVNPEATRIILTKTKNGEVRSIFLTNIAADIVKTLRKNKADGEVFLFPSPISPDRPIDFESAWRYALEETAIKNFRFHDLRHTCGSYLAMNGASTIEVAEALGHKTLQMARRYAHLTESHTSSVLADMTKRVLGNVEI